LDSASRIPRGAEKQSQPDKKMKLKEIENLTAADIAAAVNKATAALGGRGGKFREIGKYLHRLGELMREDGGNKIKTLAKYADAKGVDCRALAAHAKRAWSFARVARELLGEGGDGSGTVSESHLDACDAHTIDAASKALGVLATETGAGRVSAVEAVGFRECIASAVRRGVEADAKGVTETLCAPMKSAAEAKKAAEAAKTPGRKLLDAFAAVAKMLATTKTDADEDAKIRKWGELLLAHMDERAAAAAAKAAGETAAAESAEPVAVAA
jgi:hypothetical protein